MSRTTSLTLRKIPGIGLISSLLSQVFPRFKITLKQQVTRGHQGFVYLKTIIVSVVDFDGYEAVTSFRVENIMREHTEMIALLKRRLEENRALGREIVFGN